MQNKENWIDASVPLRTGMVHWPGDPEPVFERISEIEQGEQANVTLCRMTAHTGTHMDAPRHFLADGRGIEEFPLETGVGVARVIGIGPEAGVVRRQELEGQNIKAGERILLKTRNSRERWGMKGFQTDFVGIDASGAQFLADAGVILIGVDYLSVGVFEGDGAETHRILLRAGIWIVEGLDLTAVDPGVYDLICLPLRIGNSDGAPSRVVLRKLY